MANEQPKRKTALKPSVKAQINKVKKEEKKEEVILRDFELSKLKYNELFLSIEELSSGDRIQMFKKLGFGDSLFTCYACGEVKKREEFYTSSSPYSKTRVTPICKECAKDVAYKKDEFDNTYAPTKQSILEALELLDKPFLEKEFDFAIQETGMSAGSNSFNYDLWSTYVRNIGRSQARTKRWRDGDHFKKTYNSVMSGRLHVEKEKEEVDVTDEILRAYKNNKRDVIKFVGYDPFANYPREDEKPLLYASLCSYLDEETKNDGNKKNAAIGIVKKFNQAEKLDDQIDLYINDKKNAAANMMLINKMADTSSKLMGVANKLAQDNGISVNYNNNKSKGANTLSGKMKKLTELGFRDVKINAFDVGTCEGMLQVAKISEEARHMQIGYDENIAQEIKDIKVDLVESLTKERDKAVERARKLLVENSDLKTFILEKNLVNESFEVIDD